MSSVDAQAALIFRSDRRALVGATALSVALHALLGWQALLGGAQPPIRIGAQQSMVSITLQESRADGGQAPAGKSLNADAAPSSQQLSPRNAQPPQHAASDTARPKAPEPPSDATRESDGPLGVQSALPASNEEGYLARPMLTRAPVARAAVRIVDPDSNAPMGLYTGVFSLFIDEQGTVREVRPDASTELPPEMIQAARDAFSQAAFSPGEVDGRAVRSRLRVEVSFEHVPRIAGLGAQEGRRDDKR